MNMRMTLMTTAALALLTPLMLPTTSFAEGRGWAGHMAAGIAASPRGVGNAAAGGGVRMGGGGWNHGGGVAMGNSGGWNRGGGGGGWNHGGGRGFGGGGFFPGAVAGAVIGGAIAANSNAYYGGGPGYYGSQYGYYDQPDYYNQGYDQGPVVAVAPDDGDSVGYCMQRYRSYDAASGTYLGYDGLRHPCP